MMKQKLGLDMFLKSGQSCSTCNNDDVICVFSLNSWHRGSSNRSPDLIAFLMESHTQQRASPFFEAQSSCRFFRRCMWSCRLFSGPSDPLGCWRAWACPPLVDGGARRWSWSAVVLRGHMKPSPVEILLEWPGHQPPPAPDPHTPCPQWLLWQCKKCHAN